MFEKYAVIYFHGHNIIYQKQLQYKIQYKIQYKVDELNFVVFGTTLNHKAYNEIYLCTYTGCFDLMQNYGDRELNQHSCETVFHV